MKECICLKYCLDNEQGGFSGAKVAEFLILPRSTLLRFFGGRNDQRGQGREAT